MSEVTQILFNRYIGFSNHNDFRRYVIHNVTQKFYRGMGLTQMQTVSTQLFPKKRHRIQANKTRALLYVKKIDFYKLEQNIRVGKIEINLILRECRPDMTNPCIICVAITGSLPTKENNPAVPITIEEQIESTHEAFEAGASIAHCHVRDDAGKPTSDPDRFAALKEGIEKHCPGMIIQFSTGGRSGAGHTRGGMLPLAPDMASLSVGSNNFPTRVYENPPDLVDWLSSEMLAHDVRPEIEVFDLSHIFKAAEMYNAGAFNGPPHVQFVMGVKNAMPVDRTVFDFYRETTKRLLPDATWCGAGIGAHQKTLNEWCVAAGGHARTGLEDNVRLDKNTLAPSNAALVKRLVDICDVHGRKPASVSQARSILKLPETTAL